jgi:hypothetical protein
LSQRLPAAVVTALFAISVAGMVLAISGGRVGDVASRIAGLLPYRLTFALVFGLSSGLVMSGLETPLYVTPLVPGRAWQTTRHIALVAGALGSLAVGSLIGLIDGLFYGWLAGLVDGLSTGASVGVLLGLRRGGAAYLRHCALVWFLARHDYLPRRCVPFLDYSSRLTFLRRHGGGYEFMHDALLEYFARRRP